MKCDGDAMFYRKLARLGILSGVINIKEDAGILVLKPDFDLFA
ncbi:MAG: hypothetical protein ACI9WR_001292 [Paracoccaceae bacterium]|jgi:hypothetical protein